MNGAKSIISVCLIFFFGCVTGAGIVIVSVDRHIHDMVNGGPRSLNDMIVSRLSHELELSPEQCDKIQRIVEDTHDKIESARSQIDPQITKLMEDSKTQIRAVLTPGQASKFDKLATQFPSRMPPPHEDFGPRPHFHDGPPPPPF